MVAAAPSVSVVPPLVPWVFDEQHLQDFLMYTRGSSEDFDRYARITGDPGWSWDNMLSYFKKNEKFGQPVDNHDISQRFNAAVHGFDGMTGVSLPGHPMSIDWRVLQASNELGGEFVFNLDQNSGNPLGLGLTPLLVATLSCRLISFSC